jgi:hypothetical protein
MPVHAHTQNMKATAYYGRNKEQMLSGNLKEETIREIQTYTEEQY